MQGHDRQEEDGSSDKALELALRESLSQSSSQSTPIAGEDPLLEVQRSNTAHTRKFRSLNPRRNGLGMANQTQNSPLSSTLPRRIVRSPEGNETTINTQFNPVKPMISDSKGIYNNNLESSSAVISEPERLESSEEKLNDDHDAHSRDLTADNTDREIISPENEEIIVINDHVSNRPDNEDLIKENESVSIPN